MGAEEQRSEDEMSLPPGASASPLSWDLARLRQAVYRFLGAVFLYPHEERVARLIGDARALRAEEETFAAFPFYASWRRLLHRLTTEDLSGTDLEDEYVRLFVAGPGGPLHPPYESSYLDPGRMAAGWIPLTLEREYAAAGLILAPGLSEPPDHVAVELEYMSFLCGEEADAGGNGAGRERREILEREYTFLHSHLGRWFPAFARDLRESQRDGFYGAAAEAAEAYIHHDLDLLALLLEDLRP